jgi:hypothetical protein
LVEPTADTPPQPAAGFEDAPSGGNTPGEAADSEGAQAAPTPEALARDQQRQAQEKRQQAQIRQRNCQAARNNLERLQSNRPLRVEQGDGKRSKRYTAEERQAATREAQKQVRENCN